jgi:hypothetical protein
MQYFIGRYVQIHIKRTVSEASGIHIRIYALFKLGQTSPNIKITSQKALIKSIIYAFPAWQSVADIHIMKVKHQLNKRLHAIVNSDKYTLVDYFLWHSKSFISFMIIQLNYEGNMQKSTKIIRIQICTTGKRLGCTWEI